MINQHGEAKILDFGLSKDVHAMEALTRPGACLGTPNYMAPEQIRQAELVDARSDVYGVAATLYQMVTGVIPFDGDGVRDTWDRKLKGRLEQPRCYNRDLSQRVNDAIMRGLAPMPDDRPQDMRKFAQALTAAPPVAILAEEVPSPSENSPIERPNWAISVVQPMNGSAAPPTPKGKSTAGSGITPARLLALGLVGVAVWALAWAIF